MGPQPHHLHANDHRAANVLVALALGMLAIAACSGDRSGATTSRSARKTGPADEKITTPSGSNDDDDDDDDAPLPTVSDYLATPRDIPERIRRSVVDPPEVRFVSIERSTVEVYPPDGQRYSISMNGRALRRGGARTVPTHTFDLSAIDFSIVPKIIAAASKIGGSAPTKVILQSDDGTPQWIVYVRKGGKGQELRYALDGTPVGGEP